MGMCIQHCWLYGSIMRGSRNFRQGGGGGFRKKTLITFLRHQLFYSVKEGYEWFILNKYPGAWGPGTLDPRMRMIDPLASSVKPIPKDRFSHAMAHFPL